MQLYIMRHGEAQDFSVQNGWNDSQRPLNKQGETEAKAMADWFAKMEISPKHVFVSPYVRAQQTCALVTAAMNTTISTIDLITPLDDAKPVHDFIDDWLCEHKSEFSGQESEQEQSVLIISHMPLVCFLVEELTEPNNTPIFATAGVARIDYDIDKMRGTLQGMVSP